MSNSGQLDILPEIITKVGKQGITIEGTISPALSELKFIANELGVRGLEIRLSTRISEIETLKQGRLPLWWECRLGLIIPAKEVVIAKISSIDGVQNPGNRIQPQTTEKER